MFEGPTPKDKIKMKSFLGLPNYYKHFVKKIAQIIRTLIDLLKGKNNSQNIQWNLHCEQSLQNLKNAITFAPILKVVNPKIGELVLHTNANDLAIGAVLMQNGQIIAYECRKLTFTYLNYPPMKKKC
jgi:hypothetical protein